MIVFNIRRTFCVCYGLVMSDCGRLLRLHSGSFLLDACASVTTSRYIIPNLRSTELSQAIKLQHLPDQGRLLRVLGTGAVSDPFI